MIHSQNITVLDDLQYNATASNLISTSGASSDEFNHDYNIIGFRLYQVSYISNITAIKVLQGEATIGEIYC